MGSRMRKDVGIWFGVQVGYHTPPPPQGIGVGDQGPKIHIFRGFEGFGFFFAVPSGSKSIFGPWQSRSNPNFMDFGPKSRICGFSSIFLDPESFGFLAQVLASQPKFWLS